jgi:hypothetical protein
MSKDHGGKRENSGRKLKYGEATVKVNYRIPVSLKPLLDNYIAYALDKYVKAAQATTISAEVTIEHTDYKSNAKILGEIRI